MKPRSKKYFEVQEPLPIPPIDLPEDQQKDFEEKYLEYCKTNNVSREHFYHHVYLPF